jgi:hypothetical protein
MATDRQALKIQEAGGLGTFSTAGTAVAAAAGTISLAHSDTFTSTAKAADDGMASTTTAETSLGIVLPAPPPNNAAARAFQVNQITYTPVTGAITNDNTNNFTLTVSFRLASTGGTLTTIGTITNTVTTFGASTAQFAAYQVPVNVTIPSGGATLTFSIAKGGTGVVVRGGVIAVDGEWV